VKFNIKKAPESVQVEHWVMVSRIKMYQYIAAAVFAGIAPFLIFAWILMNNHLLSIIPIVVIDMAIGSYLVWKSIELKHGIDQCAVHLDSVANMETLAIMAGSSNPQVAEYVNQIIHNGRGMYLYEFEGLKDHLMVHW